MAGTVFSFSRQRGCPAEIIMRAQSFHHNDYTQNADDLQQRPRRENLIEQRHMIFRFCLAILSGEPSGIRSSVGGLDVSQA